MLAQNSVGSTKPAMTTIAFGVMIQDILSDPIPVTFVGRQTYNLKNSFKSFVKLKRWNLQNLKKCSKVSLEELHVFFSRPGPLQFLLCKIYMNQFCFHSK